MNTRPALYCGAYAVKRQEQQLKEIHEEASRPLDAADLDYLKQRTWRDLPQAELAERMSKGEICPRDEWIPGRDFLAMLEMKRLTICCRSLRLKSIRCTGLQEKKGRQSYQIVSDIYIM